MTLTYHYILLSQKDFLENQIIEELLRERANYYFLQKKTNDFWIVPSPQFISEKQLLKKIKNTNYYLKEKSNLATLSNDSQFFVALISFNKDFIKWVELRLGFFEKITTANDDILDFKNNFTTNGIAGEFLIDSTNQITTITPLSSNSNYFHPDFIKKKYLTALNYLLKT
jgi:hypothetical protein